MDLKKHMEYDFIKNEYELVEDRKNHKLYAERGALFQKTQNFKQAYIDFNKALELIGEDDSGKYILLKKELIQNLKNVEKPLPCSKPKLRDLSDSWFTYFLINLIDKIGFKTLKTK